MLTLDSGYFIQGKKGKDWLPFGGTYHKTLKNAKKQLTAIRKSNPKLKLKLVKQKSS